METHFGLEGEQGQAKKDADCDKPGKGSETTTRYLNNSLQSLEDDDIRIERNRYTKREGLHQSKCREKHQVPWVSVSLPVEETKDNQSTKKRDVERPCAIGIA